MSRYVRCHLHLSHFLQKVCRQPYPYAWPRPAAAAAGEQTCNMCGISLTIGPAKRIDDGPGDLLRRRGPDLCGSKQVSPPAHAYWSLHNAHPTCTCSCMHGCLPQLSCALCRSQVTAHTADGSCLSLNFAASLLQLRGLEAPSAVPLHDTASGNVLCFNGEVFGGLNVADGQNDGLALLHALEGASGMAGCTLWVACLFTHVAVTLGNVSVPCRDCSPDVPLLLGRLRGPWSLIYLNQATGMLWFGRDIMGEC